MSGMRQQQTIQLGCHLFSLKYSPGKTNGARQKADPWPPAKSAGHGYAGSGNNPFLPLSSTKLTSRVMKPFFALEHSSSGLI